MARIAEQEIERLKKDVSVQQLAEAHGIALKGQGDNLLGRCPFHADKTPSLVITPAKNLWHCLGACQAGGGPIDWVMRASGVSFRHAVELLRADPDLAARVGEPVAASHKLAVPVTASAADGELLNQVIDFYHQTLLESPEALAYLAKRGLSDPEMIGRFKLGFANRTLGYRLPARGDKAGSDLKERLQRVGILRASGHEHFNGSIVVPVIDVEGNVTEAYARKLRDDLRTGTPLHLYLPGPHKGVWNAAALRHEEVILCEALIDALTFWQAGFHNVTASYGVAGFTPDHLAAFARNGVKRVLIAYDRDDAGDTAAAALAEHLSAAGIECCRIQFPKGMDANAYALKVTPAAKSLGILIRKAAWLGKGAAPGDAPALAAGTVAHAVPVSADPVPVAPPAVAPDANADVVITDDEVVFTFAERRYRVRGLPKNLSPESLKINLLVAVGESYHVDTLDLYSAKGRGHYLLQAAKELGVRDDVIKHDLGRILLKLEALQDERIKAATSKAEPTVPAMSEAERDAAMALLRAPDLLERIVADFDACGLVGERTNKLVAYLAAVSRKLAGPLAIVVQSSSAAGKSALMDAVLAMIPEEERIKYSAMTGQSLFYMGATNLKHKILAICEEEGASRASYALKLLQSDGELTMASTGKDPVSGNLITQQYRVEGPVMIFLTTTAIEVDEELLNRCIVLSVDEGRSQTEAIHHLQRQKRTLQGLQTRQERQRLTALHQNAQRLLQPLAVVNPYADQLTFMSDKTRMRRDHEKYLTLIDAVALLHQYQRPMRAMPGDGGTSYIEVTLGDIAAANALAHDVLGRSLDELPPQTRRLLAAVVDLVETESQARQLRRADVRFSRKSLRDSAGWGDTQLRLHLDRLVQMEYLLAHRDGNGGRFVYELLYDGDVAQTLHLSGLLDPAQLHAVRADCAPTTAKSRGGTTQVAGQLRGDGGANAAPLRSSVSRGRPIAARAAAKEAPFESENARHGANGHAPVVTVLARDS
jgi:DNA primase